MKTSLSDITKYPFVVSKGAEENLFVGDIDKFKVWMQRLAGEVFISDEDKFAIEDSVREIEDGLYIPLNRFLCDKRATGSIRNNDNLYITKTFASVLHSSNEAQLCFLIRIINNDIPPTKLILTAANHQLILGKYDVFKYEINDVYIICLKYEDTIYISGLYNSLMPSDLFWEKYYQDTANLAFQQRPYFSLEVSIEQAARLLNHSVAKVLDLIKQGTISCRQLSDFNPYPDIRNKCISIYELAKYAENNYEENKIEHCKHELYDYCNKEFEAITDQMIQEGGMPYPASPESMAILIQENKRMKQQLQTMIESEESRSKSNEKNRDQYIKIAIEESLKIVQEWKPEMEDTKKITTEEFLRRVENHPDAPKRGKDIAKKIFKALPSKYKRGRGQGVKKWNGSHE